MAGGRGERFWPLSRAARPKQLLPLLSDLTLIGETLVRLFPVFPPERIIIATNQDYVDAIRTLLPQIPPENILGEPAARNTAPCIALAAAHIKGLAGQEEDPVIAVFPSDSAVADSDGFRSVISECIAFSASNPEIVTVGIKPSFPCTGYGYIEGGEGICGEMYRVRKFHEKPDAATAERYLAEGKYYWNGGMFFMRHSVLCRAFRDHAPELAEFHDRLLAGETPAELYEALTPVSIDYAVMEKASNVVVRPSFFGWDDLGSWSSIPSYLPSDGNDGCVSRGRHVRLDSEDCVIWNESGDHLVAVAGLKDMVVVHTDDATLVCPVGMAQRVGDLVKEIKKHDDMKRFL